MTRLTPGRVGVALWVLAGGLQACPLPAYPCSSDGDCDRTAGYACVDGACVSGVVGGDGGGVGGLDGSAQQPDAAGTDAAAGVDAAGSGDAGIVDAAQAGDAAVGDGSAAQDAAAAGDAAAPDDAAVPDAADVDAGPVDAGVDDAAVLDAAVVDAAMVDAAVVDAGTPDAGTPDAATPDAGPNCWDGLGAASAGAAWADTNFRARSVFRVDVTQFPSGEEVPTRLDVAPGTIPLCGLTNPMLAFTGGVAVPLEVDHVNTQTGAAVLWAGLTNAGLNTQQDVEIYWAPAGPVTQAPSPFATFVTAQHFTGGAVNTFRGGNISNTGAVTATGQVGDGLSFAGAQTAAVRNFSTLSNTTELTMSAWVTLSSVDLSGFTGVMHLRRGNNNDYSDDGVTLHLDDGFPEMEGRDFTWSNTVTSPVAMTLDTWHHLAVTARSGQSVDIYVNGLRMTPFGTGDTLQNGDIAPDALVFGSRYFGSGICCGLRGVLDEARVQTTHRGDAWVLAEFMGSNGLLDTFLISERAP